MGRKKLWLTISAILLLISVSSLVIRGLNLGIDFTGGNLFELRFAEAVTTGQIREVLNGLGLGNSRVQLAGEGGRDILIRTIPLSSEQRQGLFAALRDRLGTFEEICSEIVSPTIGRELSWQAFLALAIASVGMLIYITLRFELKFAVTGIIALLHDALITLGFFSLFQIEVDTAFVAAILTIVGYSINDTIVVYDRIRERLKERRKETLDQVVNCSIAQTLRRSLFTSITTLLVVVAILVFGGTTIRNFVAALGVGIVSGTYSSVLVASPLWILWRQLEEGRPVEAPAGKGVRKGR